MKIKAMIFDMDGVITSSSHEHFYAWRVLAQRLGFDIPDELEVKTKGVSRMDSLQVILQHAGLDDRYTDDEKLQLAAEKNQHYVDLISKFTPDNLLPGVHEMLIKLKSLNIKVALASASKNGPLLIDRLQIAEYFDYIVNPAELAQGKPAPDIFLKAAHALKVPVTECVGVEDAIAGVASIKSAGMVAIGIGDPHELNQADIIYPDCSKIDLKEVEKLL